MASVAVLEKLSASTDQKKALRESVGDLTKIEVFGNKVLIGIYIEPEKHLGRDHPHHQDQGRERLARVCRALCFKKGPGL